MSAVRGPVELTSPSATAELAAYDLSVHFDGLAALENVDLSVQRGEILGLIGPNGAGKTTLVNVLTGFQSPSLGAVRFGGQDVTSSAPASHPPGGRVAHLPGGPIVSRSAGCREHRGERGESRPQPQAGARPRARHPRLDRARRQGRRLRRFARLHRRTTRRHCPRAGDEPGLRASRRAGGRHVRPRMRFF